MVAGGQKSAFSKATFVANVADLEKDDDEGVNRDMPSSQRVGHHHYHHTCCILTYSITSG